MLRQNRNEKRLIPVQIFCLIFFIQQYLIQNFVVLLNDTILFRIVFILILYSFILNIIEYHKKLNR